MPPRTSGFSEAGCTSRAASERLAQRRWHQSGLRVAFYRLPAAQGPMIEYYPFVTRIVAGLDSNTGESRRVLYGRARAALCEQLRGVSPPLTDSEITRERLSLEAAIRRFEAEAIRRPRNAPMDAATAAAPAEETEPRPPEGAPSPSARIGPRRLRRNDQQRGRHAAPREQLVELALLAQVFEAREQRVGKPIAVARVGQRGAPAIPATAQQRHTNAKECVSAPPAAQQVATAQDLLAKLIEARQGHHPGSDADRGSRPGRRALPDAPRADDHVTPLLRILYFVFGFAQLVAFFQGLQISFELGGVASIGIFVLLYLTGSFGSIPMTMISFYGAWRGWQWPIWGAALFAFPFVILSFAFLGIGGFYSFFNRQKAPPIVQAISSLLESPRWRERTRRWRAGLVRFLWNYPETPGGRPRPPRDRR